MDSAAKGPEAARWRTTVRPGRGDMRLSVASLGDLFESLDPAPHPERDLDPHAEQFLVSWARELPRDVPLRLTIQVSQWPADAATLVPMEHAVRHHFAELERMTRHEFRELLREGRVSLAIGLAFLVTCITLSNALAEALHGTHWGAIVSEILAIPGWVAMWRPMQIYLYDWWPLKSRERLYRRMAHMQVRLRPRRAHRASPAAPLRLMTPDGTPH